MPEIKNSFTLKSQYVNSDAGKRIGELWKEFEAVGKEVKADVKEATLELYGPIGNRTLKEVSAFLDKVKGRDIHVRLNSPGGDYYAGLSIVSRLEEHDGSVRTTVDGLAASAAAIIFMAGTKRAMKDHSQLMFHNAMTMTFGNIFDHRKTMAQLEAADNSMKEFILADGKLTVTAGVLDVMMEKEEFIDAKRGKEIGATTEEEKKKEVEAEEEEEKEGGCRGRGER